MGSVIFAALARNHQDTEIDNEENEREKYLSGAEHDSRAYFSSKTAYFSLAAESQQNEIQFQLRDIFYFVDLTKEISCKLVERL